MRYSELLQGLVADMSKLADLRYHDQEPRLVIDQAIHESKLLALSGFREVFQTGILMEWFRGDERACMDFIKKLDQKHEQDGHGREDILIAENTLGEYISSLNAIVIYEKPCIAVSLKLSCSTDELIRVVIAHEVAHSVTHRGLDVLGDIWHDYERAAEQDKELFAQVYPYLLFSKPEYMALMPAFEELCSRQAEIYNNWRELKDRETAEINEALLWARRKEMDGDDPDFIDLPDRVHNDISKSRIKRPGHRSTKKPERSDETGSFPESGLPGIAPSAFSGKYNLIPGEEQDVCRQVLIVKIGSKDDVEKMILQALVHVYSHCPGITREVFFDADKWDTTVWQRLASSFKGVRVHLNLNQVQCCELQSISSAGSLPWNQKRANRKKMADINKWLSTIYASEIRAGAIEKEFSLQRNTKQNFAVSRCIILKGDLRLTVQCFIDGLNYGFSVEKSAGQMFLFANLVEKIEESFLIEAGDSNRFMAETKGVATDYQTLTAVVVEEYTDFLDIILQWQVSTSNLQDDVPF